MNETNRVVKNTFILYGRMAITVFFSLYTTRLTLSALGVTDFGIFNVVAGAILLLTFLNTAMSAATQRFMSYAEGAGDTAKLKSIFNVSVVLHLIIAAMVLVVLEAVGYFLFNGVLNIPEARIGVARVIYQFMIFSTLFTIISVPYDAVINAHENMFLFAILGVIEAVLKLAIAISLLHTSWDRLTQYGALTVLLSIFLLLIRRIYCHRKYAECEIKIRLYFNRPIFKEMTSFAGWSFLGSSSSILANYGQGIVMNMFFGTVVNAAQGIANQVSGQLSAFAGTMQKALNPMIAKSEGGGKREFMLKASMAGSKISFFLLMFFFIPVLLEMPYIFSIWLKNVPDYAIIFCRLLLIKNLIEQTFVTLNSTIAAVGNIKKFQIYSSVLTLFPLPISYFLFANSYPPYFIYIIFIGYALLYGLLTLYFANRTCGLSIITYYKEVIVKCILLFSLVLGISYVPVFFFEEGVKRLLSVLILSTVSFSFLVFFIGFSAEERSGGVSMVRSILSKLPVLKKKYYTKL